jgi:hypothetical protein
MMLILNFTHHLTEEHRTRIEALAGTSIDEIRSIPVQIDQARPLQAQIVTLADAASLSSEEWQTRPLLINPPGYAPAAFVLLAELHGCIGHFPALIRLRPKEGPIPAYEVAELLNLQAIREAARTRRELFLAEKIATGQGASAGRLAGKLFGPVQLRS